MTESVSALKVAVPHPPKMSGQENLHCWSRLLACVFSFKGEMIKPLFLLSCFVMAPSEPAAGWLFLPSPLKAGARHPGEETVSDKHMPLSLFYIFIHYNFRSINIYYVFWWEHANVHFHVYLNIFKKSSSYVLFQPTACKSLALWYLQLIFNLIAIKPANVSLGADSSRCLKFTFFCHHKARQSELDSLGRICKCSEQFKQRTGYLTPGQELSRDWAAVGRCGRIGI